MTPFTLDPDMPVDEIMRRWPATLRVMIRHRMLCIGCPAAPFHTVAVAAAAHTLDEAVLSGELLTAMRSQPPAEIRSASEDLEPGNPDGQAPSG
ncbi:DUF1858 domain-containing protein [Hoeflea sp. BAL378]|uniref:DUF1858 domain-containing protein n=1 Tax=Hoeflea sp. BAL378 TaxID=1547437 RepID=UPI000552ACD1|nr:DUF1858 domain-containing protein [Hoeflea sp. BAL378]